MGIGKTTKEKDHVDTHSPRRRNHPHQRRHQHPSAERMRPQQVKLGIVAPDDVAVRRKEIYLRIQAGREKDIVV